MKTKGEIEGDIENGIKGFFVEIFGKGPTSCRVSLVQRHVFIVVQNAFSSCERKLLESEHGQKIYKDMRKIILDNNVIKIKEIVGISSGVEALDMHHDISTTSGEETFVFSLIETPEFVASIRCGTRGRIMAKS